MLIFGLLCVDAIDEIYDIYDDVPLTQMLLQHNIGISTKEKDAEDDEDYEGNNNCVVMAEDLYMM